MKIYQADAFTDQPFKGNPAAVVIMESPMSDEWMQALAEENNLSETAFLKLTKEGYALRWFTPAAEVKLCGHATLASAHILWENGYVSPDQAIHFETLSGTLITRKSGAWIEMDFPSEAAEVVPAPPLLSEALNTEWVACGKNRMDYLLELPDEASVRSLQPDFRTLKDLGTRGLIVTAKAEGKAYDFVSRYFAPSFGIDEDPVTGSTHCCLSPWWAQKLGKHALTGYQASKRGGTVRTHWKGDRVLLQGQAVTIFEGELR